MTIDYASPTLNQYKALIRKEANLYGDIRIASSLWGLYES